jgi:hypothetical protein
LKLLYEGVKKMAHKAKIDPKTTPFQESGIDPEDSSVVIHNVYIIVDGVVVFDRVYGSIEKDPALVSSFLGAMASLSRDITGRGTLKSIEIPPMKIGAMQIMDSPQVLIAAATSESFPESAMNKVLSNIAELFLNKYGDRILAVGVKDLTGVLRDDVHRAIVAGIREAASPRDPCIRKQRVKALVKNFTSPKYSCPHYDLKLASKCNLDPNRVLVSDCEGIAFSKGLACNYASVCDEGKEEEHLKGNQSTGNP